MEPAKAPVRRLASFKILMVSVAGQPFLRTYDNASDAIYDIGCVHQLSAKNILAVLLEAIITFVSCWKGFQYRVCISLVDFNNFSGIVKVRELANIANSQTATSATSRFGGL